MNDTPCKICGTKTEKLYRLTVLSKHNVQYFKCPNCAFIQTQEPYWLKEAYKIAIIDSDTGLLGRNVILSKITAIVCLLTGTKSKVLDYGGGYGILTRMLRDIGVDCYWHDKYAKNIFARGFQTKTGAKYDLVTAFEFFEHLEDPVSEVKNILADYKPKILLLTTMLHSGSPKENWWYFVPEGGQHISLYSKRSLKLLSDKVGMKFSTNGKNLHIISKSKIPDILLIGISGLWPVLSMFLGLFYRSKTVSDRKTVINSK